MEHGFLNIHKKGTSFILLTSMNRAPVYSLTEHLVGLSGPDLGNSLHQVKKRKNFIHVEKDHLFFLITKVQIFFL
jgi:hypothetical protein